MRIRILFVALFYAAAARAHVVSMSSSELKVTGLTATFELRMPMYEVAHVANPGTALFDHVKFADARRTAGACKDEEGTYVCQATYEFARPIPDKLDVECTLFQVTVPNHVHLLYATQGSNADQVVFDSRFTSVEVRFHPPSSTEIFVRETAAGAGRVLTSVAGLLFLVTLALAARNWGEAGLFAILFAGGEWVALPLAPRVPLALSPGFLEAAIALTSAYLAVDVLLLPQGRSRWSMIPLLGLVHGLSFAAFPVHYLTGASVTQVMAIAILTALALRLPGTPRTILLALVMAGSLGWFLRLLVG